MADVENFIVGNSRDYHAVAVRWALREMGQDALIWDGIGSDPNSNIALRLGNDIESISLRELQVPIREIGSLWFRRPIKYKPLGAISKDSQPFVEQELRYTYWNLSSQLIASSMFIIGTPYMSEIDCKAYQLRQARDIGLRIPETLITNNYKELIAFSKEIGKLAFKPFNPYYWRDTSSSGYRVASTVLIEDPAQLNESSVAVCPGIFQRYIEKDYELRITVIGDRVFPAKISKIDGGSYVDWRFGIGSKEMLVGETSISKDLEGAILSYMRRLNLNYGCLDFVVSNGIPYFLEVNPTGQFLFIECFCAELPLLRSFASMMSEKSISYGGAFDNRISLQQFEESDDFKELLKNGGNMIEGDKFDSQAKHLAAEEA